MTQKEYNKAIDDYSDNIFRFAMKHLRNEMSAKDIVQETFMKVWVKHEEVQYPLDRNDRLTREVDRHW